MTSARELVGWTDQRWQAVQNAVDRALAQTAKCRQAVPKGPDQIGAKTIPVQVVAGPPFELKDEVTAPVALSVPLEFDDEHSDDEPAILRLVESAAAELGKEEDVRILKAENGHPRNSKMVPWGLATTTHIKASVPLTTTDATGLLEAIGKATALLEDNNRPGPCALLLGNKLLAILRTPPTAGETPPIQQVEQLIGSSQIVGTSALDSVATGATCGVLFRIEPTAIDFVLTELPKVNVLERRDGKTKLSVEEQIALRVLDERAIVRITESNHGVH